MDKTLLSALSNGAGMLYFDNIARDVNSGSLASAMTAPRITGRKLGGNTMIDVEVRALFTFTGIHLRVSDEITRRCLLTDLNAGANAKERTGPDPDQPDLKWRHKNIRAYVRDNRGELVWACLTLIQNWIAKGMEPDDSVTLGSFERWFGIMGGILRAADIGGFDGNREFLKEAMKTPAQHAEEQFICELASRYADGQTFRVAAECKRIDGIGLVPSLIAIADHANEVNDGQPIHMDKSGYDEDSGLFIPAKASGQFGKMMGKLAEKKHSTIVASKKATVWFDAQSRGGATEYVLHKQVVDDAGGA